MITKKLSLGKYPYTYARVSVMRSELLSLDEYHRLLKMSLNEVISFLQSSTYKKDIDELGIKYSGVELMEMALNKSLVSTWNKLRRISTEELKIIIDSYLIRADLWNIKTILRGLHTGTRQDIIASMLLPAGQLPESRLNDLIKSESAEDFVKRLSIVGIEPESLSSALEALKEKNSIAEIENFLDREYHNRMVKFSKIIPSEGKLFKQFFESEIETINIVNVLRLKRAGKTRAEIPAYVIGQAPLFVQKIVAAENKEDIAKLLSLKGVSEKSIDTFIASDSIAGIEIDLGKNLLKKTRMLLHQHPLTVDVILGYMFAKEIEVKNLKMLLKSRQLNLEDEFIEQQIII